MPSAEAFRVWAALEWVRNREHRAWPKVDLDPSRNGRWSEPMETESQTHTAFVPPPPDASDFDLEVLLAE